MAKNMPSMTGELQGADQQPAAAPAAPAETGIKFYRVVSADQKIPRSGGDYVLRKGKVIRSDNYQIDQLKNYGVELLEVSPPGTFTAAQQPR